MKTSASGRKKVFLVEDDRGLVAATREFLEREGYDVLTESDGCKACERIPSEQPDLVVLDLGLPGLDGFGVCRRIRSRFAGPILIVTGREEETDQIVSLEIGADDYVVKPVPPRVLLARIRALIRRAADSQAEPDGPIVAGDLIVDQHRREAKIRGRALTLTTVEFDLLAYLARNAGQVVSRYDIYKELRNLEYNGVDRSVDMYISRLRHKLKDDSAKPRYIKAVRGVGYLFVQGSHERN